MAATLNPYLSFNGNAREAMTFYQQVLGGELTVSTFDEFGGGGDGVMHAQLETPAGFTLMASDTGPGMGEVAAGTNFSVSLSGDDEALRGYFAGLAEGGTVTMPLEKQMWGDEFGMLTDKFGIPWMVNVATGGGGRRRLTTAVSRGPRPRPRARRAPRRCARRGAGGAAAPRGRRRSRCPGPRRRSVR